MNRFFKFIKDNYNLIIKFLLIPVIIVCAIYLLPQRNSFKYVYEIGNTWNYNDLVAPFDFPINKSTSQLEKEINDIQQNITPYYHINNDINNAQIEKFNSALILYAKNNNIDSVDVAYIVSIFTEILNSGIISYDEYTKDKKSDYFIYLISGEKIKKVFLKDIYTLPNALEKFYYECSNISDINLNEINLLAESYFTNNIFLDRNKTNQETKKIIDNLSASHGKIHKGELIVIEGGIIDKDTAIILQSLENSYDFYDNTWTDSRFSLTLLYIIICITFMVYLCVNNVNIIKFNKSLLLIVLTIAVIVGWIAFIRSGNHPKEIYIVPICIVPIIFRAFFNHKIATWGLFLTTLLAALLVPDPFYFCLSNIITGMIVITFISKLEKRSQYFLVVLVAFISYSVVYIAYNLSKANTITSINFPFIQEYLFNSILILTSYPIIFFIEKIFGYTTDVSLIELSNTNNTVLRKLSTEAPGTFQHSIQVANMSENAARKIGANVLLARVGALYHDIGKLDTPYYYSENQIKNTNPHDDLLPEQSAKILISHVTHGLEIATKYHLPEIIKDFIRTHHGTRFTSFFYRNAIEQYGKENINEDDFRYHGPKPFSKETAIVMMADSIEAAAKSLQDTDEQNLTYLVNCIVNKQIAEQQFSNANITFKEIEIVKKVFISSLKSSFHLRVKYPDRVEN
ncbi:HDIG domain-containing protein [Odoribacter sp. OttesenSCG-928-L07]|nr:HDIG domain-containing protein [Odoribacter sp. OttesenSCG-928-L07]